MPTAAEYLLHIDGITTDTDTVDATFESYSFSAASIGSQSSGAGAGKVTFNPFSITRKIDKASPTLLRACVTGRHLKKVTLKLLPAVQKGTAVPLSVIVLADVIISEISEAGNVHGGIPLEEIVFLYRAFQFTVDGVSFEYDLETGKNILGGTTQQEGVAG